MARHAALPRRAEYFKVCTRTALGFIVMGFIGFFVKLLFIVSGAECMRMQHAQPCTRASGWGGWRARMVAARHAHARARACPACTLPAQPINQIIVGA